MDLNYARPLANSKDVDIFLDALGYTGNKNRLTPAIVKGEIGLLNINSQHTINNEGFRDVRYRKEGARWKLRSQIIEELFTLKRLSSDDSIKLKKGGALPMSEVKREKQAVLLIGLPASGKSLVSNVIADKWGCIIIDPDYAKRKLPEYNQFEFGASLVHQESDLMVHLCKENNPPKGFKTLYEKSMDNNCNIIIPKIGYDFNNTLQYAENLKDDGYTVHLTLVNLDRRMATLRAIDRYEKSKRYVPLGLIFDAYGNDPILNYYKLKSRRPDLFASFGEISTDVPRRSLPICIECENNNPSNFFSFKKI